jgi:hypothetical protein
MRVHEQAPPEQLPDRPRSVLRSPRATLARWLRSAARPKTGSFRRERRHRSRRRNRLKQTPLTKLWTSCRRPPDSPRVPCEPVSVYNRTGLRPAEREIRKWRAETGARNLPRKGRNTENYRPETGIRQRNPRECRGFSHTGKYHPGDPTAWLHTEDSNSRSNWANDNSMLSVRRPRSG